MRMINELPAEVLSRIFVLGEKIQRGPRAIGLPYVGFQDLVVQVCCHWKQVAISTPELWTYIFISRSPPYLHAELYISRSGSLLLHVDMDMRTPFIQPIHPFDENEQAERAVAALNFIEQSGGKRNRWGSLIVLSKSLITIISIYTFLTGAPTPALQFVSMKWKAHSDIVDDQEEVGLEQFRLLNRSLAGGERLQLRHVEFSGLSKNFMFDQHSPLVSNLTRFTFTCPKTMSLPSHAEFSAVLSASPQLEDLSVDMRGAHPYFEEIEHGPAMIASLQVRLSLLRSFSLNTSHLYQWSLHLLQIVDARGLECLSISTDYSFSESTPIELYRYLARGRVDEALQCYTPLDDVTLGAGPIFPQLKHLNVELMTQNINDISHIFMAFPMVTHATIGGFGALALCKHPEYLPNASHFTYINDNTVDLLMITEFPNCRAEYRKVSTLVWCTDAPQELCMQLCLENDEIGRLGSEQHYRSPTQLNVDHLIIRQVAHEPESLFVTDSDDDVRFDEEDDDDIGFDADEFIPLDEENENDWDSENGTDFE